MPGPTNPTSEARLCAHCNDGVRWYPTPITALESYFNKSIRKTGNIPNGYAIRKNLCYSVQHLQYLIATLEQLSLSGVLITQTYKVFIVTGMGVVEAILFYLIKRANLQRTNEWELIRDQVSSDFPHASESLRVHWHLYRKRPTPIDEDITFERILRIVEAKKLLGVDSKFYAQLHHLRKLRNKVHLFVTSDDFDTDWNAFNFRDLELMKALLLDLLAGSLFAPSKPQLKYFAFLRPWSRLGTPATPAA